MGTTCLSAVWIAVVLLVSCGDDAAEPTKTHDAGAHAGDGPDAGCEGRFAIKASDYDQTCDVDADCVAVGEGDACGPCSVLCRVAAISVGAKAQYLSDLKKNPIVDAGLRCHCPIEYRTCCLDHRCVQDERCSERK